MPESMTDNSERFGKEEWLARFGFDFDPFAFESADCPEDVWLGSYSISFPYFDELKEPRSSIVFSKRGYGKSAYRLKVASYCRQTMLGQGSDLQVTPSLGQLTQTKAKSPPPKRILALQYTDFTRVVKDPSLESHCNEILRLGVRAFLAQLGSLSPDERQKMPEWENVELNWLVREYGYPPMHRTTNPGLQKDEDEIDTKRREELIAELQARLHWQMMKKARYGPDTPPDVEMDITNLNAQLGYHLHPVPLTEPELIPAATPFERVESLYALLRSLDIDHVFVLLELVDPYPLDSWTNKLHLDFIRPIVTHQRLLDRLHFKLFLPFELREEMRTELGPHGFQEDKWMIRELEWSSSDIADMLEERLRAASQGRYSALGAFVDGEGDQRTVDKIVVAGSQGSPRNLVRICRRIFSEHFKRPTSRLQFTKQEIEQSLAWFAQT